MKEEPGRMNGGDPIPHAEATARLVAAAPELLEALKRPLYDLDHHSCTEADPALGESKAAARAATAKAEGR